MESSEEIVTQIKKTSQSVFTELAILIALKKIGEKKGLTLLQQSDFHTPWGKVPDSEEEEAHYYQKKPWTYAQGDERRRAQIVLLIKLEIPYCCTDWPTHDQLRVRESDVLQIQH